MMNDDEDDDDSMSLSSPKITNSLANKSNKQTNKRKYQNTYLQS
jgi:hypothetical protein